MIIQKKQTYVVEYVSDTTGKVEKRATYFSKTQKSLKTTWYFFGVPVYAFKQIVKIGD